MTITDHISRSELKRLRILLEYDWPGIALALEDLKVELQNTGLQGSEQVMEKAIEHALTGYHNSIYVINVLGKLSDPIRLAAFVSYLIDALVELVPPDRLQENSITNACHQRIGQDLISVERVPGATRTSDGASRKKLYELFIDGSIRETLRENGYEQKILVGGSDSLFLADARRGYLHAYRLGR